MIDIREVFDDVKFYLDDLTAYQKIAWGAVVLGVIFVLIAVKILLY